MSRPPAPRPARTPRLPGTSRAPATGRAPARGGARGAGAGGGGVAPPEGGAGWVGADEQPGEQESAVRRRLSRRTLLQAGLIGGAGVAALPLLALVGGITRTDEQPTNLAFSMNANWLFGGQYMAGSETSFYDDSNFAPVAIPHTVTPLSWQNWDYA